MPGDTSRLQPVERLLMLLAIPEFETLGPPELRRLADAAVLTQHAAGVALAHREPPNAVEIVVEGLVELRAESGELRRLGPRDVVGSLRQVLSGAPPTSAMALVDTLTLRLDAEALEDLLEEEFGIFTAVLRGLTRSLLDRLPLPRAAFSENSAWVAPGRELDLGPAIAGILTGSFVIETIFQIPGLGREFVTSAFNRDYTLVLGTVILYAVLIMAFNLLADLVQAWMNPKIRLES